MSALIAFVYLSDQTYQVRMQGGDYRFDLNGHVYQLHLHGWVWLVVGIVIYLLPTIVALLRRGRYLIPAILVDVLLGWTLLGWLVALGFALVGPRRYDQYAYPPTISP
jgi:Superinfection immunity protein